VTYLLGFSTPQLPDVVGLLPDNKTPYEDALDKAGAGRIDALPAEIIKTVIDPYGIPYPLLPWLAWGLRVNIWSEDWPEAFQRWVVASEVTRHRIKGSLEGISEYLKLVDADLINQIRPPGTTFLSGNYDQAERDAYLAQLPQVRIYPFTGRAQSLASYMSDVFLHGNQPVDYLGGGPDDDHVTDTFWLLPNEAKDPYTIKVTYFDPLTGVETPMVANLVDAKDPTNQAEQTYYELIPPPPASLELFLDDVNGDDSNGTYLDDSDYLGDETAPTFIFRIPADVVQNPSASAPSNTTVSGGTGLIESFPVNVFEEGVVEWGSLFLDADFLEDSSYLPPDNAWSHIYEVWYVWDPTRVPVEPDQFTFLNWTYLGMPPYNAVLQVDIEDQGSPSEIYLDADYLPQDFDVSVGFMGDQLEVDQRIDDMCMATRVSMSVRDALLINTRTKRPPRPSDLIKVGQLKVGEWITAEVA